MKVFVSLTFDDGNESQYTDFYPVLEKYGFRGTFYIVTSQIGMAGKMSFDQLRDLFRHGNEIGSHTHTHPHLTKLPDRFVELELRKSKEVLEEFDPQSLACPAGDYDSRVIGIAKKYYTSARGYRDPGETVNTGVNTGRTSELYALKTIPARDFMRQPEIVSKVRSNKKWIILVLHGDWPDTSFFPWFFKNKIVPVVRYRTLTLSNIRGFLNNLVNGVQKPEEPGLEDVCRLIDESGLKVLTVSEAVRKMYKIKQRD